jgi:hypothetical protein
MRSLRLASAAAMGLGVVSVAGPVLAQGVVPINSVAVQERRFNDFPNSTLVSTDNYPAQVGFAESNYGTGGFANQHVARFAVNDTPFEFQNNQPFAISVNVNLDAGTDTGPDQRKEAGFRSDTFVAGESFFIVTADGEVAAFGGPFPFFSFGSNVYTPGTDANLQLIYRPDNDASTTDGDAATIEYRFNGTSSGPLNFGNLENGIINDSDLGLYLQSNPDTTNTGDFANAHFRNIVVAVPEPAAVSLVLLTGGALAMRRRR